MSDLGLIATFPVLPEARQWLREQGPPMAELLTDLAYNRARDRARRHVRDAMEGTPPDPRAPSNEVEAEMALLARPLARLLVAAVGEPYLVGRYAVWEAKRFSRALERASHSVITEVAQALEVPARSKEVEEGRRYGLRVAEYLMRAPTEKAWRLVNRDPQDGQVWLDTKDFARLLEEVYKNRLETELAERGAQVPAMVLESFGADVQQFKEDVKERLARQEEQRISEVAPEVFPPCMKRILEDMHEHKNVPHMGRFGIVTFLNHLDMDTENILEFFSTVPDFSVEKSRYQIEHITGKGSPEAYKAPGCATMQSYGVCPLEDRDSLCMKIKHPLAYYRKALWRKKMQEQEQEAERAKNKEADGRRTGEEADPGESGSAVAQEARRSE